MAIRRAIRSLDARYLGARRKDESAADYLQRMSERKWWSVGGYATRDILQALRETRHTR